ncbi:MAG: hypothetical protein PHE43_02945 [Candidatus Nanoarchaeia archaeon]|nr:hypothetical protein [Candidatus Nanoarchaeia archaeon]
MKYLKIFIFVSILISLVSFVNAMDACCEKTTSGEYCQYTSESSCASGFRKNYATCEQTSYCNLGCCFSQDDGRCFKNTPQAVCNAKSGTFSSDPACSISQCSNGCCIIGTESFFVTEVKCKETAAKYPDVSSSFDDSITDEKTCLAKSRSQETGCCVSSTGCLFTTRDSCNAGTGSNETKEGFFSEMLCSNDRLSCGCAKQHHTGCYQGKVYWYDSCGNRENIYMSDKVKSYNNGYETEINCDAKPNDPDCGNCDYSTGTICSNITDDKPKYGDFICKDISCSKTTAFVSSPNAGTKKENGESWCVYEGPVGEGLDLVGSRHYRGLCINGEEIIEPGKDYREEFCIQQTVGEDVTDILSSLNVKTGFIEAGFRPNRYSDCSSCNDISNCGGECSGLADPIPESISGDAVNEAQLVCCAQKCCSDSSSRDCYWDAASIDLVAWLEKEEVDKLSGLNAADLLEGRSALSNNEKTIYTNFERSESSHGRCIPMFSPGMKFWTTTYGESNSNTSVSGESKTGCSAGNQECKVTYYRGGITGWLLGKIGLGEDYECVQNCHCTTKEWVIAGNNYCKKLGDCGAYYNVAGDYTFDGYSNTASAEVVDDDNLGFNGYDLTVADLKDSTTKSSKISNREIISLFSSKYLDTGSFGGFMDILSLGGIATSGVAGWISSGNIEAFIGGPSALFGEKTYSGLFGTTEVLKAGSEITTEQFNSLSPEAQDILTDGIIEGKVSLFSGSSKILEDVTLPASGGGLWSTINTVSWAYQILRLVDLGMSDMEERTYTISCNLWQAPDGGDNCEKCNDDKLECSEYKCKSLGKTCELINPGTDEEKCIDMNPYDTNSPIIEPLIRSNATKIEKQTNGYEILTPLPAYTAVKVGIKLNEPGQCKVSAEQGKTFEEMTANFQDEVLRYEHETVLNLPSEMKEKEALEFSNGGKYTVYVRCKDGNGNVNEKDYYIRFKIDKSPDLTAPVVEGTSPIDNAYISVNVTDMPLSVFVSEPSTCKWSTNDIEYDDMTNEFSCTQSGLAMSTYSQGTYECKTTLKNVHQYKTYYIRCADQPGQSSRNYNSDSYVFNVRQTTALSITDADPEGKFYNGEVTLEVETSGGAENEATCFYSDRDTIVQNMVQFSNTGSTTHSQLLNLSNGDYKIYIKCTDIAGNKDSVTLNIVIDDDNDAPVFTQIYTTSSGLHIELDEEAKCEYSIIESFKFGDGTLMTGEDTKIHEASLIENAKKYYLKCRDKFNNELFAIIYI